MRFNTSKGQRSRLKILIAVIIFLIAVLVCDQVLAYDGDELKLDIQIRKSVSSHWLPCPEFCHWKWLKAQLIAESALRIDAVSPVGAKGIAQFMDPTWQDMRDKGVVPDHVSQFDWRWSIEAAANYMQSLKSKWKSERPDEDRLQLAQASYNAGFGNILKSQRMCGGVPDYDGIVECLPRITGKHSIETRQYVVRISRYRECFE